MRRKRSTTLRTCPNNAARDTPTVYVNAHCDPDASIGFQIHSGEIWTHRRVDCAQLELCSVNIDGETAKNGVFYLCFSCAGVNTEGADLRFAPIGVERVRMEEMHVGSGCVKFEENGDAISGKGKWRPTFSEIFSEDPDESQKESQSRSPFPNRASFLKVRRGV